MTFRTITPIALGAGLAVASAATAAVPQYAAPELQARSNFSGAFNLPNGYFFTNTSPAINDNGEVAFTITTAAGTLAKFIWFGADGQGDLVYESPQDAFLSDCSLNSSSQIVNNQFFATPSGVIQVDGQTEMSELAVLAGGPFGVVGFSSPQINDGDQIGFRGELGSGVQAYISDDDGDQMLHVQEVINSPYSFLFTPSFNNNRQIAGKARVGAAGQFGNDRPDEIRIWNADGTSVLIAEDADSDPMSPFSGFDNSVSLTDNEWVAFNASLVGGGRGVFFGNGTETIEIASTVNNANLSDVEFFGPAANTSGLVAFRGVDASGLQQIFVGDGEELIAVIGEHDIVPTDLGDARIDQNNAGDPVFGGAPGINENGDLVFQGGLTPPDDDQIEYGSGVFIVPAMTGADLNGDGVVGSEDLAILLGSWGPCPAMGPCPADLNGDGVVGSEDLAILLGSWG